MSNQDQDQTDNQEDEVNASKTPINTNELSLEDLDGVVGGCTNNLKQNGLTSGTS